MKSKKPCFCGKINKKRWYCNVRHYDIMMMSYVGETYKETLLRIRKKHGKRQRGSTHNL